MNDGLAANGVRNIVQDKESNLWASTMEDGVWLYAKKNGLAKQYQLSGDFWAVAEVFVELFNFVL